MVFITILNHHRLGEYFGTFFQASNKQISEDENTLRGEGDQVLGLKGWKLMKFVDEFGGVLTFFSYLDTY